MLGEEQLLQTGQQGKDSAPRTGAAPVYARGLAPLGVPDAHRRELVLVIETHRPRRKLVFGDDLSSERPAILRITWKPTVRRERSHGVCP